MRVHFDGSNSIDPSHFFEKNIDHIPTKELRINGVQDYAGSIITSSLSSSSSSSSMD